MNTKKPLPADTAETGLTLSVIADAKSAAVRRHLENVYACLGIHNRTAAVAAVRLRTNRAED